MKHNAAPSSPLSSRATASGSLEPTLDASRGGSVATPRVTCEQDPSAGAPELIAARALLKETLSLLHAQRAQAREPRELCWLLMMARQLGLDDQVTLSIASPYPRVHKLLKTQLELLSARAEAERATQRDDLKAAIAHYHRQLSASPYDEESRLTLGRLLLNHGERKQVERLYQEALKLYEGPCVISLKAELLIAQRRFDEAYLAATEAWELAPTHPEVLITLSKTQHWMLNHEAERDSLDRALQAHAHHQLASALALQAEDPSWLPHLRLEEVSKEFAQRPTRAMHLALVNAQLGAHHYDLALVEARRLIARDPLSQEGRLALAQAFTYNGHIPEAIEALSSVLERDSRHPEGLFLACFLSLLTPELSGESSLGTLEQLSLRSSKVALLYSHALRLKGQAGEAHKICHNLYRKYPKRSSALNAYCQSLIEAGEPQLAEGLCRERLSYFSHDLSAKLNLAESLLNSAQLDAAAELLSELTPHPKAQEFMVRVAFERGHLDEVYDRSLSLLRERPCSPDLIEYAVHATIELGELAQRLKALYKLVMISSLYPNQVVLFTQLHLLVDEPDEARRLLHELHKRPSASLSDERLLSLCEIARQLHDPEALSLWVKLAEARGLQPARIGFLWAVARWWSGAYEEAASRLKRLSQTHREELKDEELITLCLWLCELKRGAEARGVIDELYGSPSYLKSVVDAGGVDIIKARVLLYSSDPIERAMGRDRLLAWVEEVKAEEQRGVETDHSHFEVCESVTLWLIDAGLSSDATRSLEDALSQGESPSLWRLAVTSYQAAGEPELALYALDRLKALDALDDRLLLDRAELLNQLSRDAEALEAYHEAFRQIPESYEVRLERALALIRAQHLGAAELEMSALLEIARAEDAEGPLEESARRGLSGLNELSFSFERGEAEGSGAEGAEDLSAGAEQTKLGPISEHVLFLWLSQLFEHAALEDCRALINRLERAYGDSAYLKGFQGLIKLWDGLSAEALPLLKRGAQRDIYFALEFVRCLWESGQRRHAVAVLQDCVQQAPEEADYLTALIERLIELGDPQGAHSYLLSLSLLDAEACEELSARVYEALPGH